MHAYAAVTAHYLLRGSTSTSQTSKGELSLQGSLIGFLPMPGRHFGQDLAKGLLFITDRLDITEKVRHIVTYIYIHIINK
jgi:hypothetical protein